MKVRAHLIISGVVQGVNFRYHTKLRAKENNVTGWIRNLVDGRVEVVLEGEREDVENVIEFCKKGPPNAYVSNVKIKWEEFEGKMNDFEIKY